MYEFHWIALAAVLIMSTARITRLLNVDKFPPILYLRHKFEDATDGTEWQLLTICVYCMSFWVTLALGAWGYLTDWQTAWWLFNGTFAAAYAAGLVVALDKGEGES